MEWTDHPCPPRRTLALQGVVKNQRAKMTGRGASFPTYSSPGWRTTHRCGRLGSIYSSYRVYDARTGQHRLCSARNMVHHAHASSQVAALRRVVRAFPVAIPLGCVHAHTVNGTESCARRIGQTLAGRTPFASFGASSSRVRPSSHTAPLRRAGIVWYRNDLRLHDHEAMMRANGGCTSVLPVYCFDPREYQQRARGRYQKTGPYRARFRIDAVTDLRGRLREMGSDLMVVIGKPEEVIPRLANKVGTSSTVGFCFIVDSFGFLVGQFVWFTIYSFILRCATRSTLTYATMRRETCRGLGGVLSYRSDVRGEQGGRGGEAGFYRGVVLVVLVVLVVRVLFVLDEYIARRG